MEGSAVETEILAVGSGVRIKRTSGRIQVAFVSSINYDSHLAAVEWFEDGETKGKDVDFGVILGLNPNYRIIRQNNTDDVTLVPEPLPRRFERVPIRETNYEGPSTRGAATSNGHSNNVLETDNATSRFTLQNSQRETLFDGPSTSATTSNGHSNHVLETDSTASRFTSQKRSNVVKEVEKLKRNREERRQRQAEEKAEKEAFLQKNPENPNWELLNMINEYRRSIDIKPLSENDAVENHLIAVCVRKRPLSKKEIDRKEVDLITIPSKNQLILHEPKNKVDLTKFLENQLFRFDYTFDETCSNETVYKYTAQPLVQTIFEGGFATCFAYGQTGAGKTHTMGGVMNSKNPRAEKGIYALASADVFKLIKHPKYAPLKLIVSASFFEIYSGKVFDLLNGKAKLRILEDGKQQVQVVGLSEIVVNSVDDVLGLIRKGSHVRTSGKTSVNANSSRSHAVFQIYLRSKQTPQKIHGKFSLIDLAGNERGADTSSADRQTRMEGAEINKSLLALKECIRALGRKGAHLPFRVSKLTQVLRDSFVGSNSQTCMIAMVSPGLSSCEHTLNTLRYADRVKELGSGDLPTNQLEEQDDQDSDLLQLQSLNVNDMSPAMLKFHKVISELQQMEDSMIDANQKFLNKTRDLSAQLEELLRTADDVTFNGEAYSRAWCKLLNNLINSAMHSKELAEDYLNKLDAEEALSKSTKQK